MSLGLATAALRPLTLDQLAALSDELRALARAGVPLDAGLAALAADMPGRLGSVAGEISGRLTNGEPLERIVEQLSSTLPPAYQHVVLAGLKAGRLSVALEGVAATARRVADLRRTIGMSLFYPALVLSLTWCMGLFMLVKIAPVNALMLREFGVTRLPVERVVDLLVSTLPIWGALVPLAIVSYLTYVWYSSGRVSRGAELHPLLSLGAVRTLAAMQRACRYASLTDLLRLLIAHDVPLPEAVELASAAVGSGSLTAGGRELARSLAQGEPLVRSPSGFPHLIAWMLASGHSQERLLRSLARTAEVYRAEVTRRSQWLSLYAPLVLTIVVAGGFVFLYAALTLGPWLAIMRQLTEPFKQAF
jgi:type II secretory pathway component PulF